MKRGEGMGEGCEKKQMTIRLPADLREELQREADRRGYTETDLIVFILWNFVHEFILPE